MMIPIFTWNSSDLFVKYLIHLGCQKADGYNTFIYTYDYENRMIEVKWNGVTLQENFYDCCGKRIKMKNYNENGELTYTIIYIYIGWNTIYEKTIYPDLTVTETKYIYGASGHMAKITDTGTVETTTFYHTDVLGSVRQKTDSDGQALWVSIAIYKPFGGLYSGGPSDESETHLYTGKTYDYGTGLYYYGARFYDPEVGRFISQDAIPSVNRYVYVRNNPLKYVDPTGNTTWIPGKKVKIQTTAWGPEEVEALHKETGQDVEELEKIWAAFQLLLAYDKEKYQNSYDAWTSGELNIVFEDMDFNGDGNITQNEIAEYRYLIDTIVLNTALMGEQDWIVASYLAHELKHHEDDIAGILLEMSHAEREARADWEMIQFFEWALEHNIASKDDVSFFATFIIGRWYITQNIGQFGYGYWGLLNWHQAGSPCLPGWPC